MLQKPEPQLYYVQFLKESLSLAFLNFFVYHIAETHLDRND